MTEHDTLVVRWSHHNFDKPIPLKPRHTIVPGDIIDSSHYGKVEVIETQHTARDYPSDHVGFVMRRPGEPPATYEDGSPRLWTERYAGNSQVPVHEFASDRPCKATVGCVYTEGHLQRSSDFHCRVDAR